VFNPDALLIGYIAFMLLLKAALIRRTSWLGRSMMMCNICLGATFAYSSATKVWPHLLNQAVLNICRAAIAVSVTWVVFELAREARNRWTLLP
jgi:hypothetical protein